MLSLMANKKKKKEEEEEKERCKSEPIDTYCGCVHVTRAGGLAALLHARYCATISSC